MPDKNQRTDKNVPGKFYVDKKCASHGLCAQYAPRNFARDEKTGQYYVCKQPENAEELAKCTEAINGCPMEAIGNDG